MFLMNEDTEKTGRINIKEKWEKFGVLNHPDLPPITDSYKRDVTLQLLENQQAQGLKEAAPTNNMGASSSTAGAGPIDTWDPILVSLVRRTTPQLIAFDVVGVQPMTGPTGLIFAMKAYYGTSQSTEAGGQTEYDTDFSAQNAGGDLTGGSAAVHSPAGNATAANNPFDGTYTTGTGMTVAALETLGSGAANEGQYAEMNFGIDKTSVTAKSRALKAEYTTELAQDLKAVHGLDAESELANILSQEIVGETNREIIRTIYVAAKLGAAAGHVQTAGTFDLDVDANGRWSIEKFKGLMFQLMREANQIGKDTRRGKGNIMICSSDVAAALSMAGMLETGHNLNVDDTGSTFAGTMGGGIKVYIDPYWTITSFEYAVLGYKGSSFADAGIFYAPYVPLQMVRAVGENTFQPKIGFKTRYGIVANPFALGGGTGLGSGQNNFYRKIRITNLM